jgi:hypothetical protein
MGIDYCVYLGPYIEIEKGATVKVQRDYKGCINQGCRHFHQRFTTPFCALCGMKCEDIHFEEDCELDSYELYNKNEILQKQMYPSNVDGNPEDVWIPCIKAGREMQWNLKYDGCFQDMSDLDPKKEIKMVEDQCKESLDIIRKAYGKEPEIKWGIIGQVG